MFSSCHVAAHAFFSLLACFLGVVTSFFVAVVTQYMRNFEACMASLSVLPGCVWCVEIYRFLLLYSCSICFIYCLLKVVCVHCCMRAFMWFSLLFAAKVAPAMGMNFLTYEFVKARLNGVPLGLRWRSGS